MSTKVVIMRSVGFENTVMFEKPIGLLSYGDFSFYRLLELSKKDLTTNIKEVILDFAFKKTGNFDEYSKMMKIYHLILSNRLFEETDKHGRKYISYYDFNGFFVTYHFFYFNSLV